MANKEKLIASAQKFLAKGQTTKAVGEYRKLVDAFPKDVRNRQKLAELLSRNRQQEDAIVEYEKVARNYTETGFYLKAIAVYKQMQKLDSSRAEFYEKLAELNEKQGLVGNALSEYRNLVNYYEQNGLEGEAIPVLEKMLSLDQDNLNIRAKLAELKFLAEQQSEAVDCFLEMVSLLREKQEYAKIIKIYERFREHVTDCADVNLPLAEALAASGQAEKSIPLFKGLLKADPENQNIQFSLANAYSLAGDHENARLTYRHLLKLNPDNLDVREKLVRACLQIGDLDKALDHLEESKDEFLQDGRVAVLREFYEGLNDVHPGDSRVVQTLKVIYELVGEEATLLEASDETTEAAEYDEIDETVQVDDVEEDVETLDVVGETVLPEDLPREQMLEDGLLDLDLDLDLTLPSAQAPEEEGDVVTATAGEDAKGAADSVEAEEVELDLDLTGLDELGFAGLDEEPGGLSAVADEDAAVSELADEAAAVDAGAKESAPEPTADERPAVESPDHDADAADREAPEAFPDTLGEEIEPASTVEASGCGDTDATSGSDELGASFADDVERAGATGSPGQCDEIADFAETSSNEVTLDLEAHEEAADTGVVGNPEDLEVIAEIEELEEFEDLEEVAEIEELEELEDLEEVAEIEELEELEDLEELVDIEMLEEVEDLEEIADVVELTECKERQEEDDTAIFDQKKDAAILSELEDAEFYLQQGLFDDAERVLRQALDAHGEHPELTEKLESLAEKRHSAVPDESMDFSDMMAELKEDELIGAADFLGDTDLSSDVSDSLVQTLPTELDSTDTESHYNLGIAYKEMGLFDDAIAEFEKAASSPSRKIDCLTLTGQCAVEMGDFELAEATLKEGLALAGLTQEGRMTLHYELGLFYRAAGRPLEALESFQVVADHDLFFRDVNELVRGLRVELGLDDASDGDNRAGGNRDKISFV